jgi:hypothetical protein
VTKFALSPLIAATLIVQVALSAAPAQLLPVDEAASRPDFFSFRAGLQRAIARRDATALLAAVDPNIKNSFGGDDGIGEFRKSWKVDSTDSAIWDELGTVLGLGGAFFDKDTFTAPYTFARFPSGLDAFDHVVITGADVRVRSAARADAPPVTSVSFAILPVVSGSDDAEWTAVTVDGRRGFVASRFARSPVDYRAIFSYANGQWRLVTFVAGD